MVGPGRVINPYVAGNPVTGLEMFFGREDVFEFVRQALIGRHQDNAIVLHGQRRTGKTSVLYQMHRHIDPQYIPVLVDLQALSLEGTATFLWEIATSICRTLLRDRNITVERPRPEQFASQPREFFQGTFLNSVWDAVGDCRLLLMLDEAVRLTDQVIAGRLESDIFDYLRHLMQHHPRLDFIFSLGSGLEELQQEYAILFNVALYKKISFLDPEAARRLITEPANGVFEYEGEAIDHILDVGGAHAYYTQLICHGLFSRWERTRPLRVSVEDVQAVLPEAVERGAANLKFVWDQANTVERLVLAAMADVMGQQNIPLTEREIHRALRKGRVPLSIEEINSALAALVSSDTIVPVGSYRFSVDLIRRYLKEHHRLERVQDELGRALEEMRRAEADSVVGVRVKRWGVSRLVPVGALAIVVGAALGVLLIPASPLSVTGSSEAHPPDPGVYSVQKCGLPPVVEQLPELRLKLCVETVEVFPEGTMKFNISWTAQIPQGLVDNSGMPVRSIGKASDVGNRNMYITDDRGNRYDFTALGGAASLEGAAEEELIAVGDQNYLVIPDGRTVAGWFLFTPPKEGARLFTFHDDDNFWAIAGVNLE